MSEASADVLGQSASALQQTAFALLSMLQQHRLMAGRGGGGREAWAGIEASDRRLARQIRVAYLTSGSCETRRPERSMRRPLVLAASMSARPATVMSVRVVPLGRTVPGVECLAPGRRLDDGDAVRE